MTEPAPYSERPPGEPWVGTDHQHTWVRKGFGSGTSAPTMVWGPWTCWCGAFTTKEPSRD